MKFPSDIPVYGDPEYRGKCPKEGAEQTTFVARVRREYPDTIGILLLHPRNEGKRRKTQTDWEKAQGMAPGASDIIIPGCPAFVCEIKRRDSTQSEWQGGQQQYLRAAIEEGVFTCVALGADAAWEALTRWIHDSNLHSNN